MGKNEKAYDDAIAADKGAATHLASVQGGATEDTIREAQQNHNWARAALAEAQQRYREDPDG